MSCNMNGAPESLLNRIVGALLQKEEVGITRKLVEVIKDKGISSVGIVGISYGGKIATLPLRRLLPSITTM